MNSNNKDVEFLYCFIKKKIRNCVYFRNFQYKLVESVLLHKAFVFFKKQLLNFLIKKRIYVKFCLLYV